MEKSQQWKMAAIIRNLVDQANPDLSNYHATQRTWQALTAIHQPLPWEYPWSEVIASHAERARQKRAKVGRL